MLPMMKAESVTPKATRRARIMPVPHDGRVAQPGAVLLFFEPLAIGLLVDEIQRIGRLEVGVPFLERTFVEELLDPLPGRDVPVVVALGADAQPFFGLFAEDRGLAAGAAHPQALGHAPLGPLIGVLPIVGSVVGRMPELLCKSMSDYEFTRKLNAARSSSKLSS